MRKNQNKLKEFPDRAFSLKEVIALGISYYTVSQMVKSGLLEKLGTGVYQKTTNKDDHMEFDASSFYEATVRLGGNSCICLWSALFFYDITDEIVEKTWIYVPYEKTSHNKDIRLVRKRDAKWGVGMIKMEGFQITSIERTLIDILTSKKHIHFKVALDICKQALADRKVSFKDLVNMSKKMNVEDSVKELLVLLT